MWLPFFLEIWLSHLNYHALLTSDHAFREAPYVRHMTSKWCLSTIRFSLHSWHVLVLGWWCQDKRRDGQIPTFHQLWPMMRTEKGRSWAIQRFPWDMKKRPKEKGCHRSLSHVIMKWPILPGLKKRKRANKRYLWMVHLLMTSIIFKILNLGYIMLKKQFNLGKSIRFNFLCL